jgi:hypothetical protein
LGEALRIAQETRQFEIGLYWTRSAYFWAFVSVALGGFFALQANTNGDLPRWIPALVAFLSVVFSAGWYVVARASKFWQENWELHVDYLEDRVARPLFQTVANPKKRAWWKPLDGLAVSVSRVNMVLALTVTIVSDALLGYAAWKWLQPNLLIQRIGTVVGTLGVLIGVLVLFFCGTRTAIHLPRTRRKPGGRKGREKSPAEDFVRRKR